LASHRAFEHRHQRAGRNAMAGDIGNVGGPLVVDQDNVNQITAHFAARNRLAEELEFAQLPINRWREHLMKVASERYLCLNAHVAFPFSRNEEDEASICEENADSGSGSVHLQTLLDLAPGPTLELRG
jgi:hypothetical protein